MANIRIKDLSTTAAVTASDDFIAVDGATNGTRKLNAYSPTFGGNLTVSGSKVLISYPSSSQARVSFGGAHFDANSSYASYIRGYSSGANTAGLDFYTTYGSSVLALSLSEQGNATLAGNLTVSGTVQINGFSALFKTQTATLATIGSAYAAGHGSYRAEISFGAQNYGSTDAGYIGFRTSATYNTGTLSEVGRFAANGNFLLGTTTDSGNGKLQLADHTTSAGGIGFGTNMSLFKGTGNGAFYFDDNSGANNTRLFIQNGGVTKALFETYNAASAVYIGSAAAGFSTVIYSGNSSTALTLDSSQNATFAGTLNVGSSKFQLFHNGSQGDIQTFSSTPLYLNRQGNKVYIGNAKVDIDSSNGNTTFAGVVAIGNTVAAAAGVASTHKVTISIGGSTYYLLATNV